MEHRNRSIASPEEERDAAAASLQSETWEFGLFMLQVLLETREATSEWDNRRDRITSAARTEYERLRKYPSSPPDEDYANLRAEFRQVPHEILQLVQQCLHVRSESRPNLHQVSKRLNELILASL